MISHKHKFIFVQIPKTGCTSVESLLSQTGTHTINGPATWNSIKYKHLSLKGYQDKIPKQDFEKYFKFSFCRNPYSWLVSNYFFWSKGVHGCYLKRINSKGSPYNDIGAVLKDFNLDKMTFINWVKWYTTQVCGTQHELIHIDENQLSLDFIGKFENLQEDFNTICNKIGIPHQKLPHIHKTNHKHYTEYYDDETKQIVAEKYAKDIDYFGYKFGE